MPSAVKSVVLCGWLAAVSVVVATVPGTTAAVAAAPVNMLANGSFETGGASLSPWIFRHDIAATLAVETTGAVDGTRAAKVTVGATSTATHLVQIRQEGLPLQAANTYTVAFWARASGTRVINARLQSSVAPYPTFIARDFTLTRAWQQFQFTYTSTGDVPNAFVGFNLAQATGDVWLDQVALTDSNLVTNGGFETGGPTMSPWIWRNDLDATLSHDTTVKFSGRASAKISVPTIGSASHLVQLRTPLAPLDPGRSYLVSFEIKASRPRLANVRLQSPDAPYPTAATSDFNITTDWTQVGFQWTPKGNISNPFLGFNLSQDTGTVWIDDVTLTPASGTITTVAGGGYFDNGPATSAAVINPSAVALDAAGNLYIADSSLDRVRKVSAAGIISTVAGNGTVGFSGDGGPATNAALDGFAGLAVDAAGNLYISDNGNGRVRKVSPAGIISTVAGNGTTGFSGDGGPATDATFSSPRGIAVDTAGNLYIVDSGNARVRKVSPAGTISTVAGTGIADSSGDGGPATQADIAPPGAIAVDRAGNLYIVEQILVTGDVDFHQRFRKISPDGTISTLLGNVNMCAQPTGLAVDGAGNLYITDTGERQLLRLSPTGVLTVLHGSFQDCNGPEGPSPCPVSVAADNSGNLAVGEQFCDTVYSTSAYGGRVSWSGGIAGTGLLPGFSGDGGAATDATIDTPSGVALDAAGNMYIGDPGNNRVRKVSPTGMISTFAGNGDPAASFYADGSRATGVSLGGVTAVAVDKTGNVYIAENAVDTRFTFVPGRISRVSPAGTISTYAGNINQSDFSGDGGPATAAGLDNPQGLAIDAAGNLYFSAAEPNFDSNNRVRRVSASGTISTVAGTADPGFSGDGGPATNATLNHPRGLAVDAAGNLYIADSDNHRVRKVSPAGTISTFAGNGSQGSSGDGGPATSATLNSPQGLAVDASGNLYITDTDNRVRKVSPTGIISTVAGNGSAGAAGDGGPATSATLDHPGGVAVDAAGRLYITQWSYPPHHQNWVTGNDRVRKVTSP